jgi:hypothetical protein
MITISDIENKLMFIAEMGHEVPHFAYLNNKSISSLLKRTSIAHNSNTGYNSFGLGTSVGIVRIYSMNCLNDDEVIFSCHGNLLIDFLNKIGAF